MRDTHPAAKPSALAAVTRSSANAWLVTMTVVALVGVAVGAALGTALYHPQDEAPTASAQIRLAPPVDLMAMATGASADQSATSAADYVTGEVAYLSGQGFAQALATRLRKPGPVDFAVTQNATSPVVTLMATGATPAEATRIVRSAIDLYATGLRSRVDEQLASVSEAFKRWTAEAARDPGRRGQIAALRANIELQATRPGGLDVLAPPSADEHSDTHWPFGAVFGGLLGGVLALAALTGHRSRSGRVRSAFDVVDAVDPATLQSVITPEVGLARLHRTDAESQTARMHLARTLLAQCAGSAASADARIVVVGASAKSGSAQVAALLRDAAAETHGDDGIAIVDAGALGESASTAAEIAAASEVILVARLNVDTVDSLVAVVTAARTHPGGVKAVLTFRPWWAARSSRTGDDGLEIASRKGESATVADPERNGSAPHPVAAH